MHLGISIDGAGSHPAAWREPDADPAMLFRADHAVALAQLAEAGGLDYVSLDDSFRLGSDSGEHVQGQLDALLTLARVAPDTQSIGLVATVTTTHTEPFHVSKNLATLDLVSDGRAGWRVDVSTSDAEAFHFGRRDAAGTADLYDEAAEAIDVVSQLWDSWEDDAVIRDVPTGRYIDRTKLHVTNFEGRFFSVRGPSITPRSPQGRSVVFVDAVHEAALEVGVCWADVIIVHPPSLDEASALRQRIADRLGAAGRHGDSVLVLATIDVLLGPTEAEAEAVQHRLDERATTAAAGDLAYRGAAPGLVEVFGEWVAAGAVDGFHVRPVTLPSTLDHLVADVVPMLRQRGLRPAAYDGATLRDHFGFDRPLNRYAANAARAGGA